MDEKNRGLQWSHIEPYCLVRTLLRQLWMLLLAAFIGGGGFISLKYLLDWGYDPFQVILGRFFMASVCMCIVYHKRMKKITKG